MAGRRRQYEMIPFVVTIQDAAGAVLVKDPISAIDENQARVEVLYQHKEIPALAKGIVITVERA